MTQPVPPNYDALTELLKFTANIARHIEGDMKLAP
jgi:hypothetical protein